MRRLLVAFALFTTTALAASDPVHPSPTELLPGRHGDDEDEEPSHEGGMEGMHDHHSSAGYVNSSSWYGPDGQVMEPVPGLDSPMPHTHHHGATTPQTMLNETDILKGHDPNPLSYWTHDYTFEPDDERLQGGGQHGNWIVFGHGLVMSIAFCFVLPLALAFRTAKSPLYTPTLLVSNLLSFLSILSAWIYRTGTPDLYAHDSHKPMGYVVLVLFYALGALDIVRQVRNVEGGLKAKGLSLFGLGARGGDRQLEEYAFLDSSAKAEDSAVVFKLGDDEDEEDPVHLTSPDVNAHPAPAARRQPTPIYTTQSYFLSEPSPTSSTSTLHHHHHERHHSTPSEFSKSNLSSVISRLETFLWRLSVVLGYACTVSGVTIFAGACRAQYLNGCMAHLIKGSIFFGYGILTWGRYLGAWQEHGWAWNVRPKRRNAPGSKVRKGGFSVPTAEAVESFVIFLYGISNTWLERLGAKPGAPFTIHQVQHISIAVMFWFCGALGLLLELPVAKRFLSNTVLRLDGRRLSDVPKPPSWTGSFNPFPALVIGVTGLAMSAHHQAYVLAIEVHTLWGNLLALFACLRVATYVFLWLRPPRSILPSRPPTEALAAFCLSCGGFVFILSTEQVVFGAMRSGWDSIMAFLTVTISLVAIVFLWTLVCLCAKGWAIERRTAYSPSPSRSLSTATDDSEEGLEMTSPSLSV